MTLTWIQVSRFRNITDAELELSPRINLISGNNGSGKTSLLESAYFLSSARSFRSTSLDSVIQQGREDCLVLGRVNLGGQKAQIGIRRERTGDRDIRVNGETARKASELARLLPCLLLGPDSVDLLLGAPALRRRFLNWGLFHVEQSFSESSGEKTPFEKTWEEANRSLRQRNQLLREGAQDKAALNAWTEQFVHCCENLDQMRRQYIENYRPIFESVISKISNLDDLRLEYSRGWPNDSELSQVLEKDREIDQKRGFTQKGFQRADVRIWVRDQPASKVCSRGELKSIVWSLLLAQGAHIMQQANAAEMLYLVDDLASEFDETHRRRVSQFLFETGCQVLMTGVDRQTLVSALTPESETNVLFHVKQFELQEGRITPLGTTAQEK